MLSEVSILKCKDYSADAVERAVKDAVKLVGGMERFVKKGSRVLLKPNLLAAKPVKSAVTTHPSVVRAIALLVIEAGGAAVVGDSPAIGSAMKVAEKCGIAAAVKDLPVEFVELKTAVVVENPSGLTFKRLEIAKEALEVDAIINIPKLKTHAQMYLTMGVKNVFGCVPGVRKAQWHLTAGVDTSSFAGMILDLYRYLKPALTVMDAVISMEGNGPSSGTPRHTGFIAASSDAVALDRVVAEILGCAVSDVPILKKAAVEGGRSTDISRIKILGEAIGDVKVHGFKFPPAMDTDFAAILPGFIGRRVKKALTSRPHVTHSVCRLCDLCVRVCPAKKMSRSTTDRIVIDHDGCIRCYCCQEICPWGAISVKEGWLKKIVPGL
ncbi:MAG: DUF362 domain-containing protein [Deltaproteobacteria bacterium]|nr:DUF362 domain-containing protein [Deltaproteobacteria bacterium]